MLKNKKLIFLLSGAVTIVILTVLIFILFKPVQKEEMLEAEAVRLEQAGQELLETEADGSESTGDEPSETEAVKPGSTDKTETEVHQSESPGKIETEINQSESTGKTETEVHGSGQTTKKTPDTKDIEPEQPQYIGRIVEGYVEPKIDESWAQYDEYLVSLKDTYQSNIQIILDDLYTIDIDAYEWFKYSDTGYLWHRTYQWICYSILTYYDGKVPCDYYVTLDEDIHHYNPDISTKIFEVQTHGEKPMNICLDTYNYKIRVEEGIKKQD